MWRTTVLPRRMSRATAILVAVGGLGLFPGTVSAQTPRLEGYSLAPIVGVGGKGDSWSEITDGIQIYGGLHVDRAVLTNALVDVSAMVWTIPMTCSPGISEPDDVCEDVGWATTVSFRKVYPRTKGSPFWSLGFGGYLAEEWSPEVVLGLGGFLRISSRFVLRAGLRVGYTPNLYDDLNVGIFITPGRS